MTTKREALKQFKLALKDTKFNTNDKPALREAWGIYTDRLCKNGYITLKQYETWDQPF